MTKPRPDSIALDIFHALNDLSIMPPGAKRPNPRTIEGRAIRDLRDLRDFVDACLDAEGNVALDVPYDMRLIQTDKRYNLEITRW